MNTEDETLRILKRIPYSQLAEKISNTPILPALLIEVLANYNWTLEEYLNAYCDGLPDHQWGITYSREDYIDNFRKYYTEQHERMRHISKT